ncbi:hypothetical protein Nepgr_014696 [Nepenthes gracilis]|uniref:Uncharacterized protein n=1 Tax=Nepenthes gracilis TaxID=150966 RepID=A0AAD3XQR0_NEPGR|nr:hypothetical protein Nepgr_014696 [Nepenthes gracilis]
MRLVVAVGAVADNPYADGVWPLAAHLVGRLWSYASCFTNVAENCSAMCLQGAFREADSHADLKFRGTGWDLATPAVPM